MAREKADASKGGLVRYVAPLTAWALAFGGSVGWGSFVMPGTTFLPLAGPWGTVAGIVVGALVMLVIAANYHYLMNRHPDSGGAFTFVKKAMGYDHGFLCAWFLVLTYTAIIWANETALPLIGRGLFGDLFQLGFCYEIAGFNVYIGEIGVIVVALLACAFVCLNGRGAGIVQIIAAIVLFGGVVVCFGGVMANGPGFQPSYAEAPMNEQGPLLGFFNIVALAPWAYVGFESISHSAGEFRFSPKKSLAIMVVALVAACAAYALLVLIASSAQPAGYDGWAAYIADLGNQSGIASLPTFFSAQSAMGDTGVIILGFAALGGIITGLVGMCVASTRLLYSMAEDGMLPEWFGKLNGRGAPSNAILFILGVSLIIPFFGRTAISWIVDVTTVGAAIAYAYVSYCALKTARSNGNRAYTVLGGAGFAISALFLLWFLVPNILAVNTLAVESYLILAAWGILGFAFFRNLFKKDRARRLGHSAIVWVVLFSLILFTSLIWMRQSTDVAMEQTAERLQVRYEQTLDESPSDSSESREDADAFIVRELSQISDTLKFNDLVQMVLIVAALIFLFDIYSTMQKREKQMEVEKVLAEETSRAKTSFLSNMSHEIRTPMNAIIGLDNIALKDPDISPRTREQLEKIGSSAQHLLGLINDILDMSRIESGRMVLKDDDFSFPEFLEQINTIIESQCEDKGLHYECQILGNVEDYYAGDNMKLKQVLINILGNGVKFTEPPGSVTLSVEQIARFEGMRTLRFAIADTGIGMDEEYIPKIFEAFSQEDATTTNVYGGSGLGMAISKNIVEMMNGEISVKSKKGEGTTFIVTVTLRAASINAASNASGDLPDNLRALVVDDDGIACEHAQIVMSDIGIQVDACTSSLEALERFRDQWMQANPYQVVLTDYRMLDMDGIELTRSIREIDGGATAIVLLTGYSYDEVRDEAREAGVDSLLNKPLFSSTLQRELKRVLRKESPGGSDSEQPVAGEPSAIAEGVEPAAPIEDIEGVILEGRRVLLAEDIEINAEIMIDLLDMEEIETEHAIDGQVAIDMFEANEPGYYDAILMDVRMPVMDGLQAASVIRELDRPDARTIPIVALTANAFDEDVQRSLQAGMDAHLSKPVDIDSLCDTLRMLIAKRERE